MSIEYLRKLVELKNKLKQKQFQLNKEPLPKSEKLTKDDLRYKTNLELKAQLNQVSKNIMGVKKITPLKGPSKEMVADFINKQNQPIIINGKQYKYHPITAPIINDQDIQEYNDAETKYIDKINLLEERRPGLLQSIENTKDDISIYTTCLEIIETAIYNYKNYNQLIENGNEPPKEVINEINSDYDKYSSTDTNKILKELITSVTGALGLREKKLRQRWGRFAGRGKGDKEEEEEFTPIEEIQKRRERQRRIQKDEMELERILQEEMRMVEEQEEIQKEEKEKKEENKELKLIAKLKVIIAFNELIKESLLKMITDGHTNLKFYIDEIEKIDFDKEMHQEEFQRIEQKKNIIEHNFKKELEQYEQTIKKLNSNMIISQDPDESDEAYFNRLKNLGENPVYDPTTDNRAQLYNLEIFKNNLKELTNDESKIEEVYNYFNMLNPGNIFNFNKVFPLFKSTYEKIYGINNRAVKSSDIINYITSYLQNQNLPIYNGDFIVPYSLSTTQFIQTPQLESAKNIKQPLIPLERKGKYQEEETEPIELKLTEILVPEEIKVFKFEFIEYSTGKGFYRISTRTGNFFIINFCKYTVISREGEMPKDTIFYNSIDSYEIGMLNGNWLSLSGSTSSPQRPTKVLPTYFKQYWNDFLTLLGKYITGEKITDIGIIEVLKNVFIKNYFFETNIEMRGSQNNLIYGFGLKKTKNKPKQEYIKFGKINISPDKLKYKNILSVQNNNRLKLPGLKNKNVSNKLSDVILKIANNEQPNFNDINDLEEDEKLLLDNILYVSGLHKNIGTGINSIEKYKKKLELIIGEIEAGNNNNQIKNDLYDILFKLVHLGSIGEREARRYYKEILNNYF